MRHPNPTLKDFGPGGTVSSGNFPQLAALGKASLNMPIPSASGVSSVSTFKATLSLACAPTMRVRWWLGGLRIGVFAHVMGPVKPATRAGAFGSTAGACAGDSGEACACDAYRPIHLRYLPGFLGFFHFRTLYPAAGDGRPGRGIPRLPIKPQWVRIEVSSADPRVQDCCLSAMVGLLPGTCTSLEGQTLASAFSSSNSELRAITVASPRSSTWPAV